MNDTYEQIDIEQIDIEQIDIEQIDMFFSPDAEKFKKKFIYRIQHAQLPPISELLIVYRRNLGLTQAALSKRLLIPKRTIENWESGKSTPPPYVTRLIWFYLEFYDFTTPHH